jgi:hypothetical protein
VAEEVKNSNLQLGERNVLPTIAAVLIGLDPVQQQAVDGKIKAAVESMVGGVDGAITMGGQGKANGEKKLTGLQDCGSVAPTIFGAPLACSIAPTIAATVSMAVCRAGASARGLALHEHIAELASNQTPMLPVPMFCVMTADLPASRSNHNAARVTFIICSSGATSFAAAIQMGHEVHVRLQLALDAVMRDNEDVVYHVDNEGVLRADALEMKEGLRLVATAITTAGHAGKVKIAIQMAGVGERLEDLCTSLTESAFTDAADGTANAKQLVTLVEFGLDSSHVASAIHHGQEHNPKCEAGFWARAANITELCTAAFGDQCQVAYSGMCQVAGSISILEMAIEQRVGNSLLLQVTC